MPWRDLLSSAQRVQLLALPTTLREFEELYTLTPAELEFVAARRTATNRLGVVVQLFLRHPGRAWTSDEVVPLGMLRFIASQVGARTDNFAAYADRDGTRREHLTELVQGFGSATFGVGKYRTLSSWLTEQARCTDNGMALVAMALAEVRRRRIVLPALSVVERLVLGAWARARRPKLSSSGRYGSLYLTPRVFREASLPIRVQIPLGTARTQHGKAAS